MENKVKMLHGLLRSYELQVIKDAQEEEWVV